MPTPSISELIQSTLENVLPILLTKMGYMPINGSQMTNFTSTRVSPRFGVTGKGSEPVANLTSCP